jgi:hypothetical protein
MVLGWITAALVGWVANIITGRKRSKAYGIVAIVGAVGGALYGLLTGNGTTEVEYR